MLGTVGEDAVGVAAVGVAAESSRGRTSPSVLLIGIVLPVNCKARGIAVNDWTEYRVS